MPSIKAVALGLALASVLRAKPVVIRTSISDMSDAALPELPENAVNVGIMTDDELRAFLDKNNATMSFAEVKGRIAETANALLKTSPAPTNSANPASDVVIFSGPCDQGACPDLDKRFDVLHGLYSDIPSPDPLPIPIFWENWNFRVNDCGECKMSETFSSEPGCWDFDTCGGKKQTICVDRPKARAHRIWHGDTKKCYRIEGLGLGDCGIIWSRGLTYPVADTACNW